MPSAKNAARIASAYASRPGAAHVETPAPEPIAQGLELSDIMYKPREWLRLNPANEVFRAYKSPGYLDDLERDIREAGVTDPLLAMPDGLILSGESRYIVTAPERANVERLPIRLVLSPLSPEEQERRLILSNLLRFEVPPDARLLLMARAWPGYYKGDTVSPPSTKAEIAKATGLSERQIQRDRELLDEASERAQAEGREVAPEDIAQAREGRNAKRREPSAKAESPAIVRVRQVVERLRREAAEEVDRIGPSAQALSYAAGLIEEALR